MRLSFPVSVSEMIRKGDTDPPFNSSEKNLSVSATASRANPYVNFWLIFDLRALEKISYVKIWRIFDVRRFRLEFCNNHQSMTFGIAP